MLRLLADENFNNNIVRGMVRRAPGLDLVRVQDVGLSGAPDPLILDRAAAEGRVFLTHDVATITRYAWERISNGLPVEGVFEVDPHAPIGRVIDDLVLLTLASEPDEWRDRIGYVPL